MIKKLIMAMTGAVALLFHKTPQNCIHCSGTGKVRLTAGEVDCGCGCKIPETEHWPDDNTPVLGSCYNTPVLGGCYHDGTAWSLGYESACGEVELDGKTFTSLDTGWDGGAMAALREHRRKYNTSRDIPRLIVELKVVKVITHGDEPYKLDDAGSYEAQKDAKRLQMLHDENSAYVSSRPESAQQMTAFVNRGYSLDE